MIGNFFVLLEHILIMLSSFVRVLKTITGNGLIMLEGAEHATHKRLMGPSFNNASIKSNADVSFLIISYYITFMSMCFQTHNIILTQQVWS